MVKTNITDPEILLRRKEYNENENYRTLVEEGYRKNPMSMKRLEGFFIVGNVSLGAKDQLLFPVRIVEARTLFGNLQCCITAICPNTDLRIGAPLGKRWVDRKFLILPHDHYFLLYAKCFDSD